MMTVQRPTRTRHAFHHVAFLQTFAAIALGLFGLIGCAPQQPPPENGTVPAESGGNATAKPAAETIEIVFTYGSEKKKWIHDVTKEFNARRETIANGKVIVVEEIPMGSGESMDELLTGSRQAHVTSPASAAFITLANAESQVKAGNNLIEDTENLVLSPVIIAMWKPMAEAIGWGSKPLGWGDVLELAKEPEGWAKYNYPQWGRFKFGHTHPEYSNSGLISLLAEVYAATGKVAGLTVDDVNKPATAQYLSEIEKAVVHYGSSTGFFGRKMFANGPEYLSAAVLYENMVIESYGAGHQTQFPVVAIYPKEGTFWSDHPVGIVERDWVSADHREAGEKYIEFLLAAPQQRKALHYGFRPANVDVPVAAPVDTAHGVDPKQPKTILEVPSATVMQSILDLWAKNKKHANVALVLDTSGSMKKDGRMANARAGALQLLSMLKDEDSFSFMAFSSSPRWVVKDALLKDKRAAVEKQINALFASGGTALYDATYEAYTHLTENPQPDKIAAVVVLTDGEDTQSRLKIDALLQKTQFDAEKRSTRIFTIGYGGEANEKILHDISEATKAKSYKGDPGNIKHVFENISTFF